MPKIQFFNEDISFQIKKKTLIRTWIEKIVRNKGATIEEINFIFCSDDYLEQVNIDYLNHHYFTDIITFDNSEQEGVLEGDVFISIDRVRENSKEFAKNFEEELHRVIIHGVLHLLGFTDKEEAKAKEMRQEEDHSLYLYHSLENQ